MKANRLSKLISLTCFTVACSSAAPSPEVGETQTANPDGFEVLADSFADISVLRYEVPGFDTLSPREKELVYYLSEAGLAGRDMFYDQNYRYNLAVRRTLEAVVATNPAAKKNADFMEYAKRVWFSSGIHHHYSGQKLTPSVDQETFASLVRGADASRLPLTAEDGSTHTVDEFVAWITPVLFDLTTDATRVNRADGADLIRDSANNLYDPDVTQAEVEAFYAKRTDPKDTKPISWGLNSKLVRRDGELVENVYKVGGMYGAAIERVVMWLEKAAGVAENDPQKATLEALISYYRTGDLKEFDRYNTLWVKDTESRVDVINGFIETYIDAMGYRGSFESVVSIRDMERTKRIATIGAHAQWFEDHSPIADNHKKSEVVGISAKVITVVSEAGDSGPVTPIGINLPNSGWIRKDHGSKSVFLGNIVDAYQSVLEGSGILDEFAYSQEEKDRAVEHGPTGHALKVDMHEVIGHASGQIDPGVGTPKETLKNYASALEEARADLVGLYYVMDPKLIELGVMTTLDVGKAAYDGYIRNGMLTQLARILPGDNIVQSHMRNRRMVCYWAYEAGKKDNVIERVEEDGKIYFLVRDYDKLRALWGQLLAEVQRIKSTGDFEAGRALIEDYGIKVDRVVHDNVLERYSKLSAKPYMGFIQPRLVPVKDGEKVIDVKVEYPDNFVEQMLEYGERYSFLPTFN